MLKRVAGAPAHTLALRASGTVIAKDLEAAIAAAVGPSSSATGLVVILDPDFDSHFAELARGLAKAALRHKNLVKLALVGNPDQMDEARISGLDASPVTVRLFEAAERSDALEWAAAAIRGE